MDLLIRALIPRRGANAMVARLPLFFRQIAAISLRLALFILISSALHGCGDGGKKAPEPVINENAHITSKLEIVVAEDSGVDRVEVYSTWGIHNVWCAPIRYPSGSFITKDLEVGERVEKANNHVFVATIEDDRFNQDNCKWGVGGFEVRFMRDHTLLATGAIGMVSFKKSNTLELTCVSEDKPPICWSRSREAFLRSHFGGVFNTTLKLTASN